MMSHRLACELCHKIAAIASVTGSLPETLSEAKPSRPVSVLIINGTKDPLMPWEGGHAHLGRLKIGKVLSTHDTVKFWVANNKCQQEPAVVLEADKYPGDGIRVRREVYAKGKDRTEVVLYTVEGGGHTWPSGLQYLPEWIIGKTSWDIDANEVIWDFFKRHSTADGACKSLTYVMEIDKPRAGGTQPERAEHEGKRSLSPLLGSSVEGAVLDGF